ncbi:CDP-glycerol glycerophosphotransferase family protein [Microbacterium sp. LRZ72]|uniref:CDP-glycerol glycerophosphotransferase family protein n=1 Tax=Microbacterium sp. LRZ72 TaxID=2942481 RepID=UPI0029B5203F|nr:CDP-glycerol glycerophosphotransferase family protein [Microbacterium sp. LRZ72]MDX2377931.1 CDP-glycerol glycerophosphotransferase family protein [Microbacterium sp. LRZ72]
MGENMAAFSFAAGNAAKLARIPIYLLGRLATALIPRRRDAWVVGCAVGVADGALALWRQVERDGHPALWLTTTPAQDEQARAAGIPAVRAYSPRGFWVTARARVIVVTHGFGDVNRYAVHGGFIVQLWHGIPLKRIGLDSPATVRSSILPRSRAMRAMLRALYRGTTRRICLIPAASHLVRGRLESAFGLDDERVPVVGEPRTDVLSEGAPSERRERARALVTEAVGALPTPRSRIVLYAPTWRDGTPDPAVPTPGQWEGLVAALERADAVLLVRSHPLGGGDYTPPRATDRVRALGSDLLADPTPVLAGVDVLVTDYSSLVFDAALVPLPVVHVAPDAADYAVQRGFYGRYEDIAGTDSPADWDEAVPVIEELLQDRTADAVARHRSRELSERVHAFRDGGNARRVYRAILSRTGISPRAPATRGQE